MFVSVVEIKKYVNGLILMVFDALISVQNLIQQHNDNHFQDFGVIHHNGQTTNYQLLIKM